MLARSRLVAPGRASALGWGTKSRRSSASLISPASVSTIGSPALIVSSNHVYPLARPAVMVAPVASASLAPFHSRSFTVMWMGALVSNIGTWMETVALAYYVAETTGKASWAAIVGAAGFLPSAVLGPIGSAMSDRLHRGHVLIVT